MALIAMCVYSTLENQKDNYLRQTLQSLKQTVNFDKHRLMLSVNGFTEETKQILEDYKDIIEKVIWNEENLGTAEGLNKIIRERKWGEHVCKVDDDVLWHEVGWLDDLETVIRKEPKTGIAALKRNDLEQHPDCENSWYKTTLRMLPHDKGEPYYIVEDTEDVMGTCTLFSSSLLDKVGYSFQPTRYGFEDNLMAQRSRACGLRNYFLPHIKITHLDKGGGEYAKFKSKEANAAWKDFHKYVDGYKKGTISVYYNPFEK